MVRPTLQPRSLAAFEAMGDAGSSDPATLLSVAVEAVLAERETTPEELKGEMCVVCMEGPREGETPFVCLRGCGHFFHRGCLGQWRSEGLNGASCPACRAPLPEPIACSEAGGPMLLELVSLADDVKNATLMLDAGASCKSGGTGVTALMWAHWLGSKNVATLLTGRGWQLTNGDLEGLQRLRDVQRRNQPKTETTVTQLDSRDVKDSSDDAEPPDPDLLKLLQIDSDLLWRHMGRRSLMTHAEARSILVQRMTGMSSVSVITLERPRVEDPKPRTAEFLAACTSVLDDSAETALEAAKLFSARRLAEGHVVSLTSAIALRIFLGGTPNLYKRCSEGFAALCSQAPLGPDTEAILPFLTQLQLGLEGLPSLRGTQFLGINVQTRSGTLREVLDGEMGFGSFHPGGLLMWRSVASTTSDPMIAKVAAKTGSGGAIVLKLRGSTAKDVSNFSLAPDLGERLFPPRRFFRVAGIYALDDMILRRGLTSNSSGDVLEIFEAPDIGAMGTTAPLSWEDACSRRACCVLLDEEDQLTGK